MQAAKLWRTNFPNHDRLTPESNFSSLKAIDETIEIGEKSDVMPVITHMKVQDHEQGSAAKVVSAISMRLVTPRTAKAGLGQNSEPANRARADQSVKIKLSLLLATTYWFWQLFY